MTAPSAPDDCLFCKIVAGDIPSEIVHASDLSVAFRDVTPQAPTHVLVIPRSHHPDAASLAHAEPGTLVDLFATADEVARAEGLTEGYRTVFNTGAAAHQTVFHAHLHVLGGREMSWPPG
ncbi:histidine triad nucleotide-binding protein [Nocardioides donggukensis]|uniref:Histidine triad nucleotide-binding protein n=1 Tax=Nocardioides donggukensis TaxID=2774019 RepID=A0A927Q009_9ACTN|nr:histidine triad nucleotide-binding protein [Nocardioides donggukensis]MBD8870015.1 histidine triad nucleotide-binding protein [Nocardioides donggukensis]